MIIIYFKNNLSNYVLDSIKFYVYYIISYYLNLISKYNSTQLSWTKLKYYFILNIPILKSTILSKYWAYDNIFVSIILIEFSQINKF